MVSTKVKINLIIFPQWSNVELCRVNFAAMDDLSSAFVMTSSLPIIGHGEQLFDYLLNNIKSQFTFTICAYIFLYSSVFFNKDYFPFPPHMMLHSIVNIYCIAFYKWIIKLLLLHSLCLWTLCFNIKMCFSAFCLW